MSYPLLIFVSISYKYSFITGINIIFTLSSDRKFALYKLF